MKTEKEINLDGKWDLLFNKKPKIEQLQYTVKFFEEDFETDRLRNKR